MNTKTTALTGKDKMKDKCCPVKACPFNFCLFKHCKEDEDKPDPTSLKAFVDRYIEERRPVIEYYLSLYKNADLKTVIQWATLAQCPLNEKQMHSHQWRVNNDAKKDFSKALLSNYDKIQRAKDFEDLFLTVHSCENALKHIGPLTIYDAALRISAALNLRPTTYVYLHAHAMLPMNTKKGLVLKKDLPIELHCLEAYEIEDFLCITQKKHEEQAFTTAKWTNKILSIEEMLGLNPNK